jgi:hypothetical protein
MSNQYFIVQFCASFIGEVKVAASSPEMACRMVRTAAERKDRLRIIKNQMEDTPFEIEPLAAFDKDGVAVSIDEVTNNNPALVGPVPEGKKESTVVVVSKGSPSGKKHSIAYPKFAAAN